ncbi:glycerophosphocholine phosphodiesterase gpcpd1 [Plakobranchus ocellatus]|uniref:Glycerophosphocholine phosphodiesterase gpcpd1 n=1 Tax=Plakobranchus ocellatus TaxID=259542 RepID=A0AAV4BBF5_9GAST|nr:glycerophosphocholine phosphodiesterase gpcpd1 [Plakobranchus ocellatus]
MDDQAVDVTFVVTVGTEPGQCVCVTGDDDLLGAWDPARMVRMGREFTGNGSRRLWTATVSLPKQRTYHYRYVVCKDTDAKDLQAKALQAENITAASGAQQNGNGHAATEAARSDKHTGLPLTVYRWETNVKPRVLMLNDCESSLILPGATFGTYDGFTNINKGWLINQCEIQIRLHSDPIYMWKPKHREQTYSIKCTAVDYSQQGGPPLPEDDDDSRDSPPLCHLNDVYACNLNDHELCVPQPQGPVGLIYNHNDYIVFRSQMPDPGSMGFQLDFYVCESNRAPKFVGSSHLLPHKQKDSQFKRKVPIIGCKYRPIGELTVECLIAKPVPGMTMKLDSSYQTHWKKKDLEKGLERSLDIGHRGMGASYSRVSTLKENTVASFTAAFNHGADFVEFDVLLSKDKVPVVYHDFAVKVLYSNKKKHNKDSELFEIPVQSLTLAQLQSMRLFSGEKNVEINNELEEDSLRHDPFPTLEEVLKSVDESLGFNVEIKYPQELIDDTWEMENFVDPNENLDQILRTVFAHAGSRKIVFSSFDPDTCILLKLKQNKYPVMFLHQGQTNIYVRYKDHRASAFGWGINFALSEHLLGLALHTEVLLRDLSLLERCFSHKMVVFVWGDDNNDPHIIRQMRNLKVDGVIYDRIDCHKPEHQGPEFQLSSAKDAASFMQVVKADEKASVHICDAQGQLSENVA